MGKKYNRKLQTSTVDTRRRYRIPSNEAYLSLSKVKYGLKNSPRKKSKKLQFTEKVRIHKADDNKFRTNKYTQVFNTVYEIHKINSVCSYRPKCWSSLKKQWSVPLMLSFRKFAAHHTRIESTTHCSRIQSL